MQLNGSLLFEMYNTKHTHTYPQANTLIRKQCTHTPEKKCVVATFVDQEAAVERACVTNKTRMP